MDPAANIFLCERFHCSLTPSACAARQAARRLHSPHNTPTHPGYQDCEQGKSMTKNIQPGQAAPTRGGGWNWQKRNRKQGEETSMGYPNKIDNEKLKRMVSEGKFNDEIAKEFNVVASSVAIRIKKLGLTPNYRRQPKSTAVKPATAGPIKPIEGRLVVRERVSKLSPLLETPAQIIPVTLRLTIEVNVRVMAQGA